MIYIKGTLVVSRLRTKMAAEREIVAVPESPSRRNANVNTRDYVKAWLEDLGGEFKENAETYTEALALAGYRSKRGLRGLDDVDEIQTALAIPRGVAKERAADAQAMQIRRGVRPMATIGEGDARAAAPADGRASRASWRFLTSRQSGRWRLLGMSTHCGRTS